MSCEIIYKNVRYTEEVFRRIVENAFKKYKASMDNVAMQDAMNKVFKLADATLSWTNFYDNESSGFEPRLLTEKLEGSKMVVPGLDNVHFNHIVNHIFNKAAIKFNVNYNAEINLQELTEEMKAALDEELNAHLVNINNIISQLELLPQENNKVKQYLEKANLAKEKIELAKNNFETISEYGLKKLFKYAGIKAVVNEETNTITVEESNNLQEADKEENDVDESLTDFDEVNTEREENYSQTSLEKNPKNSVRKELRLLMAGIPSISKDGNKVTGAMGIPVYMDFDTVFDTCLELLADKNLDFDTAIDILKDAAKAKPWMNEFIERIQEADSQVKNQFLTVMGNHALKMEFVQYSFNRENGTFHLKVMNTNSAELRRKVLNSWKTNFLGSDLVDVIDGSYFFNRIEAGKLYNEYKNWTQPLGQRISLKSFPYRDLGKDELSEKLLEEDTYELTNKDVSEKILNTIKAKLKKNEDADKNPVLYFQLEGLVNNRKDSVTKTMQLEGDKVIIRTSKTSAINQMLNSVDPTKAYEKFDVDKKLEIIETVQKWLEKFGIELDESAIHDILLEKYYTDKNERMSFKSFITEPKGNSNAPIGLLAKWLHNVKDSKEDIRLEDNLENSPLRDSSIENGLAKLQAKYTDMFTVTSFRSGKKSIYGFTAYKFLTDRIASLVQNDDEILDKLSSLSFSKHSAWLKFLKSQLSANFGVSHLDLNAIKEAGKKIYKDNGITELSDADHELVKLAFFMDMKQGSISKAMTLDEGLTFALRTARMLFPTMSDKTTMTVIESPIFSLNNGNLYTRDAKGNLTPNSEVTRLIFNQTVLPEIERIIKYKERGEKTNIKGYDNGATMLMFMPELNNLKVTIKGVEQTLNEFLNSSVTTIEDVINNDELLLQIYPEINNYITTLVGQKMQVWKDAGYLVTAEEDMYEDVTMEDDQGQTITERIYSAKSGQVQDTKYLDNNYITSIKKSKDNLTMDEVATIAASDFVINSMITNANAFMTVIGDPALYFKSGSKSFSVMSEESFINVGKRLAAMIAPGSKIANSKNEQYYQIFLADRVSISENIEFLTELLDNKEFDRDKYNLIMSLEDKDEKKKQLTEFVSQYPNTNGGVTGKISGYFDIESTDAQEYTTWKEHLHILKQQGKVSDKAMSLSDKELKEAEEMFTQNIPLDKMTEGQKEILKKVMQPLKPVYTGQIYDQEQDVMRMMYIKSSSFPLIPQMTAGLELDKLRTAFESFEKKKGKFVRASFQTANKVGALSNPLQLFSADGTIDNNLLSNMDAVEQSSLLLNRKDFKIQQDVPFKSLKRKEDTITMGSQLTKILFGNGIMDETGFMMDGKEFTGKKLHDEYTKTYIDLYNHKKSQLFKELGINEKTGEPYNIEETAIKIQKLLKEEAIDRGWSKQELDSLEIEFIRDKEGNIYDYKFKLPLWMSPNIMRIESLLNAVVNNRIVKMKFPGNSYVVGSEEGFKIQKDFTGIDQSKIVWLNSFKGELEAAKYDKDNNLKSAQVLVSSKFRDNEGNLIDLLEKGTDREYKYVIKTDKGFVLDEEMFDPELLNLLTFRIPTSGHVSGSHVTIAGFLPHENGDLMIVPKNFTKQKGLDFDIDKENGYQLWHYQDENGKIRQLKEGDKVSNIREKLLQNKLVKIHNAVFSNKSKSVQKKINAILSIDYAQEQAALIDETIKGNNSQNQKYFTPLSDEYQKGKMFLGAAGKVGTGAYSLDVTSHSLFEQAKVNGAQLRLQETDVEGNVYPFSMSFGNRHSSGKLGEPMTIDKQRTIAEVLAERQNIAVDNEKEQVMGRVNLNKYTLDVDKVLCMLGFDKGEDGNSIPFLFLSQPIIKDYVAELAKASSNTKEFDPEREEKVIKKLFEKYNSSDFKQGMDNEAKYANNFSSQSMMNELKNPSNFNQSLMLSRFIYLKNYGVTIRSIQTAINTDSKGLGKSIPEVKEKLNSLKGLLGISKTIVNAEKLIGEYVPMSILSNKEQQELLRQGYYQVDDVFIQPTTVNGVVSINALLTANNLWGKHFPYESETISRVTDEILVMLSGGASSESKQAERRQLILKEIKKFINSKVASETLFENESAQAERKRLFYDDEKSGHESLASYLNKLMKSENFPKIKSNKLLQRFDFDIDYSGKPSLIIYNNTAAGNFDEDALNNSLGELLNSDTVLPSFNGKIYTAKLLAQDLINYAMLEGGVQESVQFAKFIPLEYLEKMGFTAELQNMNFDSVDLQSEFGINNDGMPSKFATQFAQNNPTILRKITLKGKPEKLKSFEVPLGKSAFGLTNDGNLPSFVSYREGGIDYLWKKIGNKYIQIPVTVSKGNSGHKLFSYDVDLDVIKPIEVIRTKSVTRQKQEVTESNSVNKKLKSERFGLGTESLGEILQNILNDNSLPKNITGIIKQLINAVDSNTTITLDESLESRGKFTLNLSSGIGKIRINKSYAESASNEDLARTILKETVHSVTDGLLLKHTDENGQLVPKANTQGAQAVRNLISLYNRVKTEFNKGKHKEKYAETIAKFEKLKKGEDVGFTAEEKNVYYGAVNMKEFVEMIMTQPEFQQALSEIKMGTSEKTLWDKALDFIKSILQAIGVEEGTVTDAAINQIFNLIEAEKGVKLEPQVQQTQPVTTERKTYSGKITSLKPNQIFVFGSNIGSSTGGKPTHGAGNAKVAKDKFGAIQGQPRGVQGQSYGIVTKKYWDKKRSSTPEEIKQEINNLYEFAKANPDKEFMIAYTGGAEVTGNSGYSNQELADMFSAFPIPFNIVFENQFSKLLSQSTTSTQPVVSENTFTTKVDQFTYTYNPSTGEVIHNAKSGDKVETNETQINKVLAAYAKANNFETKTFNKQQYVKVGDKVLNVNTGSRVTQKEIVDLFEKVSDINEEVYNKVKNSLVSLIKDEELKIELDINSVEFADDYDYSKFTELPLTTQFLDDNGLTLKQYKFIESNKELFEKVLEETKATTTLKLLDTLSEQVEEADVANVELFMSEETLEEIENMEEEVTEELQGTLVDLGNGVMANKGQSEALFKLNKFINTSGKQIFTLKGRGGTGKTTIIRKIIEDFRNSKMGAKIAAATPSHKAKIVLANSLGRFATPGTIASAIGVSLDETNERGEFIVDPNFEKWKSPFYNADVIIIDECSMIPEEIVQKIIDFSVNPNVKIIFMGDNVQLPPIRKEGDILAGQDSSSFISNTHPDFTATLTERMRQGEESPIVTISDIVAANVESAEPELRVLDGHRKSKFNPNTGKGILFETEESSKSMLEQDLKNPDTRYNTKIIAFRNKTIDKYNTIAREIIWGDTSIDFNEGELITSLVNKQELGVFNGEEYVVLSSSATMIPVIKAKGYGTVETVMLPGFNIRAQKEDGSIVTFDTFSKEGKALFKKIQKETIDIIKQTDDRSLFPKAYYANKKNPTLVDVDYAYAVNTHKVQGSTVDNVYVLEDDILSVGPASIKQKNQSLYVAITRPRNKAVILSSKNASVSNMYETQEEIVRDPSKEKIVTTFKRKSFEPKLEEDWTSQDNECGI